jgi:hypothetical protein
LVKKKISDGLQNHRGDHNYLDYYANDKISNQIIPFCRRDNINDGQIIPTANILIFIFEQLNERNICLHYHAQTTRVFVLPINLKTIEMNAA